MAALLGAGGRRDRRVHDPRRPQRQRRHPGRGRDGGRAHPPAPARPGAARHRPRGVRRGPRAEPADRPRPGACPRRTGGAAARPAAAGHVGDRGRAPPGRAARRRRRPAPVVSTDAAGVPTSTCGGGPGGTASGSNRPWRPPCSPPCARKQGDVLVFLPGAGEIRRVGDLLDRRADRFGDRRAQLGAVDVRPLHGIARAPPTRTPRWPRARPGGDGSCWPPTSPSPASPSTACGSWSTAGWLERRASTPGPA